MSLQTNKDQVVEIFYHQERRSLYPGPGPGPGPPSHPHGGITHPQPQQGGSYWDCLKAGGGLNPNNPYHPFPASPVPRAEPKAIEAPAFL
jgi:hypothetical protein